jgi:hypothetical protein
MDGVAWRVSHPRFQLGYCGHHGMLYVKTTERPVYDYRSLVSQYNKVVAICQQQSWMAGARGNEDTLLGSWVPGVMSCPGELIHETHRTYKDSDRSEKDQVHGILYVRRIARPDCQHRN